VEQEAEPDSTADEHRPVPTPVRLKAAVPVASMARPDADRVTWVPYVEEEGIAEALRAVVAWTTVKLVVAAEPA
jgi:hypothetical protein